MKTYRVLPFLLLFLLAGLSWLRIIADEKTVRPGHWAGLFLLGLNAVLYFRQYRAAIGFTGLILLAATFQLLLYSSELVHKTYFFKIGSAEITTPNIEWRALILFILFCVLNLRFLLKGSDVSE